MAATIRRDSQALPARVRTSPCAATHQVTGDRNFMAYGAVSNVAVGHANSFMSDAVSDHATGDRNSFQTGAIASAWPRCFLRPACEHASGRCLAPAAPSYHADVALPVLLSADTVDGDFNILKLQAIGNNVTGSLNILQEAANRNKARAPFAQSIRLARLRSRSACRSSAIQTSWAALRRTTWSQVTITRRTMPARAISFMVRRSDRARDAAHGPVAQAFGTRRRRALRRRALRRA